MLQTERFFLGGGAYVKLPPTTFQRSTFLQQLKPIGLLGA